MALAGWPARQGQQRSLARIFQVLSWVFARSPDARSRVWARLACLCGSRGRWPCGFRRDRGSGWPASRAVMPASVTYRRSWDKARSAALTPAEYASPPGKRVYDLRHACV